MNVISFYKPKIIGYIKRSDISIAFALLFTCADVGYGLEMVGRKDLGVVCISSIVHNTEKCVEVCLLVAVLYSSHLIVDTFTVIAAIFD